MVRFIRSLAATMIVGLAAVAPSPAQGVRETGAAGNIRWEYEGAFVTGSDSVNVRLVVDRDRLIEGRAGEREPGGWRYHGHILYRPAQRWYRVSALEPGPGNRPVMMMVGNPSDSIVGYLEGRFGVLGDIETVWHPSANPSAAVRCRLRLVEMRGRDRDGMFETDFIPFWNRFRDAVRKGNRRAVAGMTRFPLEGRSCLLDDWSGNRDDMSRHGFLGRYSEIFDDWVEESLLEIDALNIETYRYTRQAEKTIPGMKEGALIYVVDYMSGEFYKAYYFARVGREFRLVYCDCAG